MSRPHFRLQHHAGISLADYFRGTLHQSAQTLDPRPQEDTCWYLGNLMQRFGHSDQLFACDEGRRVVRPLALLYGEALECHDTRHRCLLLQQLGDLALFLGALFPEYYARRGIRRDYFVGMGGGAYDYLSGNAPSHRHIFAELAERFAGMIELVANACHRQRPLTDDQILELYRRWQRHRDPVAERQLRALGIPTETDLTH